MMRESVSGSALARPSVSRLPGVMRWAIAFAVGFALASRLSGKRRRAQIYDRLWPRVLAAQQAVAAGRSLVTLAADDPTPVATRTAALSSWLQFSRDIHELLRQGEALGLA